MSIDLLVFFYFQINIYLPQDMFTVFEKKVPAEAKTKAQEQTEQPFDTSNFAHVYR